MSTARVTYLGNLRTRCIHLASGDSYLTDAPVDNQGKGEAFSPTDTVATGLANCMLTVMAIKANQLGVVLDGSVADVTKTMTGQPRRIAKIQVQLALPTTDEKNKAILENSGRACPVALSLHPDIEQDIHFNWGSL